MKTYSEEVKQQQYKHIKTITLKIGHLVIVRIHVTLGNSNKLSLKYTGPYRIIELLCGNKFRIHVRTGETQIRRDLTHNNMAKDERLLVQNTSPDMTHGEKEALINDTNEQHPYRKKLRSRYQDIRGRNSDEPLLISHNDEFFTNNDFHNYVEDLLKDLGVHIYSFYR